MDPLTTERLVVRVPPVTEAEPVADYFARNAAFHAPFDPPRPPEFCTAGYWRERLRQNEEELLARTAARFFLFDGVRVVGHASVEPPWHRPSQGKAGSRNVAEGQGRDDQGSAAAGWSGSSRGRRQGA